MNLYLGEERGLGERCASARPAIREWVTAGHRGVPLLVAVDLPGGGFRRPQSWGAIVNVIPPMGFEASLCP
ncbi:hypothetical protein [Mycobacterium sp. 852002-40037_SCH5390672]|uniref:hypothetical protein n=1 Tax=Mycobacterium sp. 852002-40037_SCH5390672 TaxID=1834089 RepID=UPI0012E77966|nr:hypothetical protein [Mycobacterium sp. 852002-40037_SCH5390672]